MPKNWSQIKNHHNVWHKSQKFYTAVTTVINTYVA